MKMNANKDYNNFLAIFLLLFRSYAFLEGANLRW